MYEEFNKENYITFCYNCFEKEPCNCDNKHYIRTLEFIFDRIKNYKPY